MFEIDTIVIKLKPGHCVTIYTVDEALSFLSCYRDQFEAGTINYSDRSKCSFTDIECLKYELS